MANPPLAPDPPLAFAPFCDTGDPRLEQSESVEAKEIRDAIELAHLKFSALFAENLAYPALAFVAPCCQVFPTLGPCAEQAINVLFQQPIRFYLQDHAGSLLNTDGLGTLSEIINSPT